MLYQLYDLHFSLGDSVACFIRVSRAVEYYGIALRVALRRRGSIGDASTIRYSTAITRPHSHVYSLLCRFLCDHPAQAVDVLRWSA